LELLARLFQARLVKGTFPESREQKQMAGALDHGWGRHEAV
jgi:hypothetical protein